VKKDAKPLARRNVLCYAYQTQEFSVILPDDHFIARRLYAAFRRPSVCGGPVASLVISSASRPTNNVLHDAGADRFSMTIPTFVKGLIHMHRMIPNRSLRGAIALALLMGGVGAFSRHSVAAHRQLAALHDSRETHLGNVRQLTFGGQNAEAYFSPDGRRLTFQSKRDGYTCDQQFVMNIDGTGVTRISTGQGRTTCGWWIDHGKRILFSSTHGSDPACPAEPDFSHGYVWPVYPTYRIYTVKPDGTDLKPLFPAELKTGEEPGYNAESVVSPNGKQVVFTSDRGGDLDIWVMDIDGKNPRQLTHTLGYDGGPWWSPDGKRICYRAYHPETEQEQADYKALLMQHLIRPTTLDLWVMDADGSHQRRITNDRAANIANFAPSWTHDGHALVFASNRADPKRRNFEVYRLPIDGDAANAQQPERITYGDQFDGFPCFSPDGKHLVWASNRNGHAPHETNLFIADWTP
jgi:Tol biopolymer transport system component